MAVKVLKETATREAEEDFMREVEVMSAFQHPHILRLIGVMPRGTPRTGIVFLMNAYRCREPRTY